MGMYWRTFHHKNKFIQRLTLSRFVTATTVSGGYNIDPGKPAAEVSQT